MNQTQTTWNPFRDLNELSSRLNSLAGSPCGTQTARGRWSPSVDVQENEDGYAIHADLPRVDKDNVTLTFSDRVLTVEGERKAEEKAEGTKVHLAERSYGRFLRSFRLPEDANGESIKATFTEGVLTITVPKREETKPKTIEINAN